MRAKMTLFCAALLLLICVGSGERREMNDMAIVLGLGVDAANDGLLLSVELAHQQGVDQPAEALVFSAAGQDLEQAGEHLAELLDRELFWGSAELIVCGRELAESGGLYHVAAQIYDDTRFDPKPYIVVADGTAQQALGDSFGEADYVSQGLAQALADSERQPPTLTLLLERGLNGQRNMPLPLLEQTPQGLRLNGSVFCQLRGDELRTACRQ
ncbi:MAG: hypothetical protein Q4B96_06675 [Bacillota bacterium]|nr:hypothetical protein [Bacillota bacterium]